MAPLLKAEVKSISSCSRPGLVESMVGPELVLTQMEQLIPKPELVLPELLMVVFGNKKFLRIRIGAVETDLFWKTTTFIAVHIFRLLF